MKHLILVAIICLMTQCSNDKKGGGNEKEQPRFTEKQIAALGLDSTIQMDFRNEDLVSIDISAYLKERPYTLDSVIAEVSLLPLETSSKSIIGTINELVITNSHIYIFDTFKEGGIVIFNRDGSFIKRIAHGKGPGELSRLYDIDFDESTSQLVAYEHSFLSFYTEAGEFIKEERLPFGLMNFKTIPDGYAFYTLKNQGNKHLGRFEKYQLFITDRNFKIESAGLLESGLECLGNTKYLHDGDQDNFFITQKCIDTIYQYSYEGKHLEAKYVLDYTAKKMPEEYLIDTYKTFETAAQENDYYFSIGKYMDKDDFHVFSLFSWYRDHEIIIYRNKITGNVIGGSNLRFNLDEMPPITFPATKANDYFVTWYHPGEDDLFARNSTIIAEEDKGKIQNLTINDNPVLVFYKLKDF